jgi:hypothetical protein
MIKTYKVIVSLNEIINNDFEGFLDLLSEKATGDVLLSDIQYKAVNVNKNGFIEIEVIGDDSLCHEEEL